MMPSWTFNITLQNCHFLIKIFILDLPPFFHGFCFQIFHEPPGVFSNCQASGLLGLSGIHLISSTISPRYGLTPCSVTKAASVSRLKPGGSCFSGPHTVKVRGLSPTKDIVTSGHGKAEDVTWNGLLGGKMLGLRY